MLDVLRREKMPAHDLFAAAREPGLRRLDDVQLAVLQTGGKISFFVGGHSDSDSGAPERPQVG